MHFSVFSSNNQAFKRFKTETSSSDLAGVFYSDSKLGKIGRHEMLFCSFTKDSALGLRKIQLLFLDNLHSIITACIIENSSL